MHNDTLILPNSGAPGSIRHASHIISTRSPSVMLLYEHKVTLTVIDCCSTQENHNLFISSILHTDI